MIVCVPPLILKLGSLFEDVPSDLQKVNFPFTTTSVNYDIDFYAINYDVAKDELLTLRGRIKSNDYVADKDVESLLTASQDGNKDISINWTHSHAGERHHFEIVDVQRKDSPSEVVITWNDKIHNTGFKGDRTIIVSSNERDDYRICDEIISVENY